MKLTFPLENELTTLKHVARRIYGGKVMKHLKIKILFYYITQCNRYRRG